MRTKTRDDIEKELSAAELELREPDLCALGFWKRVRITPMQWSQEQYPGHGQFWVIGILGNGCLYFNHIEGGWGWGGYEHWGKVSTYHYEKIWGHIL